MGITANKSSIAEAFGRALGRMSVLAVRIVNFPVAAVFAIVGQFAFGWVVMSLTPSPDPASPGNTESAVWAQAILLLLQGAMLVFAVSREKLRPPRIFLAIAALVWAVASMLLVYVALECDLGGVCL